MAWPKGVSWRAVGPVEGLGARAPKLARRALAAWCVVCGGWWVRCGAVRGRVSDDWKRRGGGLAH